MSGKRFEPPFLVRPDGTIVDLKVEGLVLVLSFEIQDMTGISALPIKMMECKPSRIVV